MGFYEKQNNGTYKAIENIYAGKSAYDEAVENGFNGTEKEWLATLHTTSRYTISVPTSGWSGASPYIYTLGIAGILPSDMLFWDIELSASDTADSVTEKITSYNLIDKIEAGTNIIKIYCWDSPPMTAFNLKVVAVHAPEA